jgi:divinyl protochlorophyllide a 8-vinyl-reductase
MDAKTSGTIGPNAILQPVRLLEASIGCVRAHAWAAEGTATYLLRHRIPRPFQRLELLIPAPLALRCLAFAIGRHAWTFVGTGDFRLVSGATPAFEVRHCPICRGRRTNLPCRDFYAGTFSGRVRALVDAEATVREVECEAMGQWRCRFEIDLKH